MGILVGIYLQRSNYLIKDSRVGGKKGWKGGRKKIKGEKKEKINMERLKERDGGEFRKKLNLKVSNSDFV